MTTATPSDPPHLEPMTWTLLGRFFGVPLFIIGTIVGGAVTVVLLFGGPAAPPQRSLESLLDALESNSGERSAGVLLPREKELWQTALELSERLEKKTAELDETQLHAVAVRLAAMVHGELANLNRITASEDDLTTQRDLRSNRFDFLLRALARTECEEAVEPLVAVVNSGREPYVAVAIQQLANLHQIPASRSAYEPILNVLSKSSRAETLLTACTALSVLAPGGDPQVVKALNSTLLSKDGEVGWSAALALARLGDAGGKSTLLDMMDRQYLESGNRYRTVDASGNIRQYPLPPQRIEALILATVEAASNLDDRDLWVMIDRLKSDASPAVRGKAVEIIDRRARRQASGGNG